MGRRSRDRDRYMDHFNLETEREFQDHLQKRGLSRRGNRSKAARKSPVRKVNESRSKSEEPCNPRRGWGSNLNEREKRSRSESPRRRKNDRKRSPRRNSVRSHRRSWSSDKRGRSRERKQREKAPRISPMVIRAGLPREGIPSTLEGIYRGTRESLVPSRII